MAKPQNRKNMKDRKKQPQRKRVAQHDEYGKSGRGVAVCKSCFNIKFKKEWHHPGGSISRSKILRGHEATFTVCPACNMSRKKLFEGEIKIKNIPVKYEGELLGLIVAFDTWAQKKDPQDRIISIVKGKNVWCITTTENQIAVRLGKKIHSTFKKTSLSISYSKEPAEVARINISF